MPIDKSWLTGDRTSVEYKQGLESFIEMCKSQVNNQGKVRCACSKCHNVGFIPFKTMAAHMRAWGIWRNYTRWVYHGESVFSSPMDVDDTEPANNMFDLIEDIRDEECMDEDSDHEEENSGTESSDDHHTDFDDLLKEAQTDLYPGCTRFSSLDFLAKIMHIKVKGKWTNSSFDQLLELLQSSHPEGNKIPPSFYAAKKTLKKIGLGYESIHVCKYDCALFWKENSLLQNCPVCNESRWVDKNTKGKKVAHKVLRYFPLTPRLRRMYGSRHTARNMIWHNTGGSEDGTLCHPVDALEWKEFDLKYPNFSSEPRNVRLGLAADGFNPFGMSSTHSTWPVVLTTYNLPPWKCMNDSTFMLTLLIPGPKSPAKDMDIFLRPLVDELKDLWFPGVQVRDAATNTLFTMKAALLWTINDFPARGSLSGWSGQGYLACPTCNKDTPSTRVTGKCVYVGTRRFLDANHFWRKSLDFDGKPETRAPPKQFSEDDIQDQLDCLLDRQSGKHPDFGGVKKNREDFELNWSKRSIFYELEYWSSLKLKHNLDVMHIERNVCDSVLGTLLMNDKSKDTPNARADLKKLNIRRGQWLEVKGKKYYKPHPKFSLKVCDRKHFCQFIKDVKLPDGFGSNISKRVTDNLSNITGLKSHDCHILIQRLIPIGVRAFLTKDTYTPIVDLCMFFKQLCSRTLKVEDMKKAKNDILTILCKLELIYPPAFFDIMVHLVLHLPDEAIRGGPVCMRWMYPFERYMKKLKNYVRNMARPEACMAEGYVAEEAISFCSMYLRDVQTRPDRNEDVVIEKRKLWVFESQCRPASAMTVKHLSPSEKLKIEWFILDSCQEVRNYMDEFKSEYPEDDVQTKFPKWFLEKVYYMKTQNSPELHEELYALSMGAQINANTYTACIVNGVRFMVVERDAQRTTQNSGVLVEGENGEKYYGQLEDIIEMHYPNGYSTVLFRCKWFDTRRGVRCENNITSINTEHEWHKEDQLIFASQAKQVFYIREATFTPVGTCNDAFTREIAIYIWRNIALDKKSWKYVSPAEKNAMLEHLRASFNMDEIRRDVSRVDLEDGIEKIFMNRYKGRKHLAKLHFDKVGGYDDIERAKTSPPEDMDINNWLKVIEFFKSDGYKKQSEVNKEVRKNQKNPSRGGTATYSSACHKQSKTRINQYRKAHTRKDGTWDSPLSEARYNELLQEYEAQSKCQPTFESEEGFVPPNIVPIFEKVLGTQRRRIPGIGHKPASAATSSFVEEEVPSLLTDAQYNQMFQDPRFRARMKELLKDPEFKNDEDTHEEDKDGETDEDGDSDDDDGGAD